MEQEELDKDLLEVEGPSNVPLPNVPSTSLPARPGISSVYFIKGTLEFFALACISVVGANVADKQPCRGLSTHGGMAEVLVAPDFRVKDWRVCVVGPR